MKSGKPVLLISIIFLNSILISGCWNYNDIDKMSIVSGAAIDKSTFSNNYLVTLEIVDFEMSGKDAKQTSKFIESEGKTIFDAVRNVLNITGKRAYWAHAQSIIISQDIAKEGILPIVDFFMRDAEMREEMYILVSTDKTAREVLYQQMLVSQSSSDNIQNMMENQKNVGKSYPVKVFELVATLEDTGISVVLPTIHLEEISGKISAVLNGSAIFKSDKLIGFISLDETRDFLFVINKLKSGIITLNENSPNPMDNISLEIFKSQGSIKPQYSSGKIIIKVDVKISVSIGEVGTSVDYIDIKNSKKLKKDSEEKIKTAIEQLVKKVQFMYDSDIFGFGKHIRADMPDLWNSVGSDWNKYFQKVETNVNVTLELKASALLSKSITKGD